MVDGIAIVELGKLMLDAEPYEERPEAEAWEPAPVPSSRARASRARVADRAADGARARARAGAARASRRGALRGLPGLARTLAAHAAAARARAPR